MEIRVPTTPIWSVCFDLDYDGTLDLLGCKYRFSISSEIDPPLLVEYKGKISNPLEIACESFEERFGDKDSVPNRCRIGYFETPSGILLGFDKDVVLVSASNYRRANNI